MKWYGAFHKYDKTEVNKLQENGRIINILQKIGN